MIFSGRKPMRLQIVAIILVVLGVLLKATSLLLDFIGLRGVAIFGFLVVLGLIFWGIRRLSVTVRKTLNQPTHGVSSGEFWGIIFVAFIIGGVVVKGTDFYPVHVVMALPPGSNFWPYHWTVGTEDLDTQIEVHAGQRVYLRLNGGCVWMRVGRVQRKISQDGSIDIQQNEGDGRIALRTVSNSCSMWSIKQPPYRVDAYITGDL